MFLNEFQHIVDDVFPSSAAMVGDAVGLHIDSRRSTSNKVLICLEVTEEVVQEATELGCDTILTFHPLIYTPLVRIDRAERVGRLVARLIEADIALLCVHTAFDAFPTGTNAILAHHLGLQIESPLQQTHKEGWGMGLITRTTNRITIDEFVETVAMVCKGPVRFSSPPNGMVEKVAIVAGSGMSFLDDAIASGADTFLTSDIRYHGFHAASNIIGLVDPGHYEMEQFVPQGIFDTLNNRMYGSSFLVVSSVVTNPIRHVFPFKSTYSSHHSGPA